MTRRNLEGAIGEQKPEQNAPRGVEVAKHRYFSGDTVTDPIAYRPAFTDLGQRLQRVVPPYSMK